MVVALENFVFGLKYIEGDGLDYSKIVIYFFFSPAIAIVQPQILKN